ncbi:sigma-54 interaction domain-containing protein [Brevibacillus laterosporus]|uniref:Sigma 54-interacting transcriptional regulator n=1 Tax=Brevibacillus laterosporus TaxID=1465 RepID=A0AAP3DFZ9_BRELA|nr:sigma 54-interacting transcriptional regulator [Brevibacillus laterosporus]MCR8980188.1 sigma 54-interacting transcriptional regulator [Brevibacillus laterosporus]MCZ0807343.1 sigma 54-interacting transcriptional regulator [Brevibacillus laterosporus]MCZ0825548.1 sigma 54-interacting transcriptional regulator [Brevibacillus laterosporus]MCZ0849325.1 sigma 54-interacting transcriptional regulator [Brevibacillus laterosporus]
MMALHSVLSLEYLELLEDVFEKAYECIVVTDPEGIILMMNHKYRNFIGIADPIGRHVTTVIENTRMHVVAKTGLAELAEVQRINGREMIANRVPIYREEKMIAVLGTVMFQDVRQLHALSATVDQLKQELDYYKGELQRKLRATYRFEQIVSTSDLMNKCKELAMKVANSDTTVLITGESGTGKELFAHAIHAASQRAMGPFIRVNCAAIPDNLLESELFGYEEGAFTGALRKGKKGKFELADRGTILLDEIGDMPLALQAKLLRILQEKEVERVGASRPISLNVRVIASTNKDMIALMKAGKFREDLFYRLHVVTLTIPPLRDRLEDLPYLVEIIREQLMESTGIVVKGMDEEVWELLRYHSWPGNVRELRNVLERAMHMMEGKWIRAEHILLPTSIPGSPMLQSSFPSLKEWLAKVEREALQQAVQLAGGNKREAAKLLGISKSSFYQKWEKLIDRQIKQVK